MLGVFASVLLMTASGGQLRAPEASSPQAAPDFRLVATSGNGAAYVDIANIYRAGDGVLLTRVYIIPPGPPATVVVGDGRFDCARRHQSFDTMIAYDRSFQVINPSGSGPTTTDMPPGSAAEKTFNFVCGSAETRRQAQYLGADWQTAAKMVDARFR